MRINVPTDLLRSFVTIVDTGSMVRASEHIFLTQSALSLQMKRLADILQQPIFLRHQGNMNLTPAGELLLKSAREILAVNDQLIAKLGGRLVSPVRIGMVQDFADAILSEVLSRFKRANPYVNMEIRVGISSELQDLMNSDLLDIILHISNDDSDYSISSAKLEWFGDQDLLSEQILPIALMSKPCIFRDAAIESLEKAARPYRIAVETPSISVLRAAVESSLAITCRTSAFLDHRHRSLDMMGEDLPKIYYNLSVRPALHSAIDNLADLIRTAMASL